jgi:hypothetical protein
MTKVLETRRTIMVNGRPKIITKEMSLPNDVKPKLTGRGKGERRIFDRLGPAEIGPGTRARK